jgi:hypothetical protein
VNSFGNSVEDDEQLVMKYESAASMHVKVDSENGKGDSSENFRP